MQKVADDLAKEGRVGYVIPGGGSNPIGAKGYVSCAQEIQQQIKTKNLEFDWIVVPSGSSGTHAGLVTGFWGSGMSVDVVGINVSRDKEEQEELVYDLVKRLSKHIGITESVPRERVICFGDYWKPMYSVLNEQTVEAVNMMAKTEGILLDPVYTGKAMAGMVDLSRKGFFRKDSNVLFVHTGGSPALYAYTDQLI